MPIPMNATVPPVRSAFNPWPWALLAFFALLLTTIASFIVFALGQDLELVRPDYYEQELRHDRQMERVRRTTGLAGAITLDEAGHRIVVEIPSAHVLGKAAGVVHLYRPSDSRLDQELTLSTGPNGRHTVDTRALRAGLWKVRVEWTVGGDEFYRDATVVIPTPVPAS